MKYTATLCGQVIGPRGKPLKLVPKANGYLYFSKSEGKGNPNQTSVHRFIYEQLKGGIPGGMVVDHIDGDKHNNCAHNLRAVTQRDNVMAGKGAKLTKEQVAEIRNLLGTTTNRNIAKQFGVSEQLISNIKTNVRH